MLSWVIEDANPGTLSFRLLAVKGASRGLLSYNGYVWVVESKTILSNPSKLST